MFLCRAMRSVISSWLLGVALLGFWSCQTPAEKVATPPSIADVVLEEPTYSLFRVALVRAGLPDLLKDGRLTLLVPTDSAFTASGINPNDLMAMPVAQAQQLVRYHVLTAPISTSTIPAGPQPVMTLNGHTVFLNRVDNTVYANGARLVMTDKQTANGLIHTLDRVLTPATGTLLATIQANPNLTLLAAAIQRINTSNQNLLANLNNADAKAVTLLAPTDDAFKKAGYTSVKSFDNINVQTLSSLINYHIIADPKLTYQFTTGTLATQQGSRLTVTAVKGFVTIKGNKNGLSANILTPDVVADNGVMHLIDQVLLP